ncbi:MAG: four helix bundle protein [Planctomycetes bacterium]|nr:four helix bundle protein [Planctomycetota bacterium]MCW8136943.1 four helix bundle protein [Planctomycetota bacterium]
MATFESYREIKAWQNARVLVRHVHGICKELDARREWVLKDQLFRASLSIMNNIAEGFGRYSNPEFLRFLGIARGSGYETGSCLDLLEDIGVVDAQMVAAAQKMLDDTMAPLGGLMNYLRNNMDEEPGRKRTAKDKPKHKTPNTEHRTPNDNV